MCTVASSSCYFINIDPVFQLFLVTQKVGRLLMSKAMNRHSACKAMAQSSVRSYSCKNLSIIPGVLVFEIQKLCHCRLHDNAFTDQISLSLSDGMRAFILRDHACRPLPGVRKQELLLHPSQATERRAWQPGRNGVDDESASQLHCGSVGGKSTWSMHVYMRSVRKDLGS